MKAIRSLTQICIGNSENCLLLKGRGGASVIEYVVLTVIIFSALYVMKDTVARGIFAKHKMAGDSFAFGRQYDARRSTVCKQDVIKYNPDGTAVLGDYYDEECYVARVMRPTVRDNRLVSTGGWDVNRGGCPQCRPGDTACFACEDAIKYTQCNQNEYCKY